MARELYLRLHGTDPAGRIYMHSNLNPSLTVVRSFRIPDWPAGTEDEWIEHIEDFIDALEENGDITFENDEKDSVLVSIIARGSRGRWAPEIWRGHVSLS